ncbi:unnamed protein product, partial [Prorocentrum cordatum]
TMFEALVEMPSKKTWYLYGAAERFCPVPRWWHPDGVNLSWYVFDRGEKGSLSRCMRRRHLQDLAGIPDPAARHRASLLDWVMDSACADHDVQNALCVSCSFGIDGKDAMYNNIFKAIRSARDTLDTLMETLPEWLRDLQVSAGPYDMDAVRELWLAMGAKPHIAEPGAGEWYSHCYDLLDPVARRFVCKTALASHATDRMHALLLKDDRVAKNPAKFVDAVHSGIQYLHALHPWVLQRLAMHVEGLGAEALESDVYRSSYHAAAYVDRKVFAVLRKPIFEVCCGDVAEKCAALQPSEVAVPPDPILAKVQALLRLGYPMACVEQAFDLMREAPWSILRWEQMHGAGA